jgi:nucleoside-diphosphate-sugar epimerase
VVIRPPLVYGPGVKGNFAKLVKIVRAGVPLPLGAIQNTRSLVGVDNLVDLLERCTWHSRAAGQTFLVSDGEDLSTPDLIRRIAAIQKRSPRLLRVPPDLLRLCARLAGCAAAADRLLGSLRVDTHFTRQTLEWSPPCNVTEGLREAILAPINMEVK